MALWFHLMVNDDVIGTVDIVRMVTSPDGFHEYNWRVQRDVGSRKVDARGSLMHHERNGAFALAANVLAIYTDGPAATVDAYLNEPTGEPT